MEEEAKDNFRLIDEQEAPEVLSFFANCKQLDWLLKLPSIIGEDLGEKFRIKADFGNASGIFFYNQNKKIITLKSQLDSSKEGVYYIILTLYNKNNKTTRYGVTIIIVCPS